MPVYIGGNGKASCLWFIAELCCHLCFREVCFTTGLCYPFFVYTSGGFLLKSYFTFISKKVRLRTPTQISPSGEPVILR